MSIILIKDFSIFIFYFLNYQEKPKRTLISPGLICFENFVSNNWVAGVKNK